MTQAQTMLELADEIKKYVLTDWDEKLADILERAENLLRASATTAAAQPVAMEKVLEESEKLDGTLVQTVQREDGTEYVRERGLTMLELLIRAGYDASLPHPECFNGFSYLKLAEILGVPLVAALPAPQTDGVRERTIEECAKICEHEASLWEPTIGSSAEVAALKIRALSVSRPDREISK